MQYYTYIYLDPEKPGHYTYSGMSFLFEPFYVGKGVGGRKYVHLTRDIKYESNKLKARKIAKLKNKFDLQTYIVTINADSESIALELERQLITEIGRRDIRTGPLCNLTEGGDGSFEVGPLTRKKQSEAKLGKSYEDRFGEERAKEIKSEKSRKNTGKGNPFYGKKHSPDIIAKMVANHEYKSGPAHCNYGKPVTLHTRLKMSESHKLLTGVNAVKAKFYEFISPDGIAYYIAGAFAKHCKELGIKSPSYLRDVANGKRNDYNGWKCRYITRDEYIQLA